jgi:hypothetical protein
MDLAWMAQSMNEWAATERCPYRSALWLEQYKKIDEHADASSWISYTVFARLQTPDLKKIEQEARST